VKILWILKPRVMLLLNLVVRRIMPWCLALFLALNLFRFDVPVYEDRSANLDRLLAGRQFDFVSWWIGAAAAKAGHELTGPQNGMAEAEQVAFVRDYMTKVAEFQKLEGRIEVAYADPAISDPVAATLEQRRERDALRGWLNARQILAEAIVQEQIEYVLREEGFAVGGQVSPPLRFRFTELPDVLIVSRRDRIERIDQRGMATGMTVDEKDRIEDDVDARFDVSSLVTPIGGLAAYPTMLPETSSLNWLLDVVAHEWAHNYLMFTLSYVGTNLTSDPVALTINETAANIVGREIGPRVAERFYPELSTTEHTEHTEKEEELASITSDISVASVISVVKASKFDFRKEMRETRVRTDEMLAAGKVEEAEAYMEARRALFVQNGHHIRKLNQAYFAFYGAYNDVPGGAPASGKDPVGPAVQALRTRSASVGEFLRAIAGVQTLADVENALR
jgi:hypothetical protein